MGVVGINFLNQQFCAVLCYSVSLRPFHSVLFHLLSNSGLFLAFSFSFNAILCSFVPLLWFCASLLTLIFSIYTHSVPFCAALCHSVHKMAQNGTERVNKNAQNNNKGTKWHRMTQKKRPKIAENCTKC